MISRYRINPACRFWFLGTRVVADAGPDDGSARITMSTAAFAFLGKLAAPRALDEVCAPDSAQRAWLARCIEVKVLIREAEPLVVLERPDCRQVFFLFQAGGPVPQHAPGLAFLRASGLVDRNLVVCRDDSHRFCVAGLSDEIDGFAALIAWCRRFLAERPHLDEVYCLGSSMGAVAAILVGHHVKAQAVWAFSPAPRPRAQDLWPDEWPGARPPRALDVELDLRAVLAGGDGATRYEIFFNRDDQAEPECPALCRELAGCPGVTLVQREGTAHLVAADLGDELARRLPPLRSRRE